jgi:hypothetical protein
MIGIGFNWTGRLEFRRARFSTVALPLAVSWTGDVPAWICVHVLWWGVMVRWHRPWVVRAWLRMAEMKAAGLTYAAIHGPPVCDACYRDPTTGMVGHILADYCGRCRRFYDEPSPHAQCAASGTP